MARAACYVVEYPRVPVFSEPSYEAKEVDALYRGDLLVCGSDAAEAETSEGWLSLRSASVVRDGGQQPGAQPRRRRPFAPRPLAAEGSEDSDSGTSSASGCSPRAEPPSGTGGVGMSTEASGYVLRRHPFFGALLRALDSSQELRLGAGAASVRQREASLEDDDEEEEGREKLPEEARLWSDAQRERFLAKGIRPNWSAAPGRTALGGQAGASLDQLEDSLRTATDWLSCADAILVACGEGTGVDASVLSSWPGLRALDMEYQDFFEAELFASQPRLAWAFWLHCCRELRLHQPHTGYDIMQSWFAQTMLGGFVCTSSVDGRWLEAGHRDGGILESRGNALYLQCSEPCCDETWPLPENLGLREDPETHEALGDLPLCPRCGRVARPAVEMFGGEGDDPAFAQQRVSAQELQRETWSASALQGAGTWSKAELAGSDRFRLVVLELDCSPWSVERRCVETSISLPESRLIRVNAAYTMADPRLEGRAVSLQLPVVEALRRLQALGSVFEMASFLCQDSAGNGAEVLARRDALIGHVTRRVLGERYGGHTEEPFSQEVQSVFQESRLLLPVTSSDRVPKEYWFRCRDQDAPVVRINIKGVRFSGRNETLERRVAAVRSLIRELNEEFGAEDYQRRLEACTDRNAVTELIREVHVKVLPSHGMPISKDTGSENVQRRVMQMQAFLQSGKPDPEVLAMIEASATLSGYLKMRFLPFVKRERKPVAPEPEQVLVAVSTSKVDGPSRWTSKQRPPKVLWIVGTWSKFKPEEMKWNGSGFVQIVKVSGQCWESFQLLVEGRWEAAVYPSVADGNPFVEHELRGPDSRGHGKNWTIGRNPKDKAKPGDHFKVLVSVDGRGAARKVTWSAVTPDGRPRARPGAKAKAVAGAT